MIPFHRLIPPLHRYPLPAGSTLASHLSNALSLRNEHARSLLQIASTDQETAIVAREPLQTLMTFRSGKLIRPDDKKNRAMSYFGQYVVWNWNDSSAKESGKVLKVGDPVYVLQKFSSPAEAPA